MSKTIKVSDQVYQQLMDMRMETESFGMRMETESFGETVQRLLLMRHLVKQFMGALKGDPEGIITWLRGQK